MSSPRVIIPAVARGVFESVSSSLTPLSELSLDELELTMGIQSLTRCVLEAIRTEQTQVALQLIALDPKTIRLDDSALVLAIEMSDRRVFDAIIEGKGSMTSNALLVALCSNRLEMAKVLVDNGCALTNKEFPHICSTYDASWSDVVAGAMDNTVFGVFENYVVCNSVERLYDFCVSEGKRRKTNCIGLSIVVQDWEWLTDMCKVHVPISVSFVIAYDRGEIKALKQLLETDPTNVAPLLERTIATRDVSTTNAIIRAIRKFRK